MKYSNKYIQTEKSPDLVASFQPLCISLSFSLLLLSSYFYLPLSGVPAPPSGSFVDFHNRRLLQALSLDASDPHRFGRHSNADERLACLISTPRFFSSQDNWVILTNAAQKLSGSMEMFSVGVLIFSASSLLRDSMTVWHQP